VVIKISRCIERARARAGGYFWLPCPVCNVAFSGREWAPVTNGHESSIPELGNTWTGTGICPSCTAKGIGCYVKGRFHGVPLHVDHAGFSTTCPDFLRGWADSGSEYPLP
jgi:hypothetical protein